MRRTRGIDLASLLASFTMIAFAMLAWQAVAGEDRTFESDRLLLIKDIQEVLIEQGLCADRNDCYKKQLVFAAPESHGLDVEVYQQNDPAVLSEIVRHCALITYRRPEMKKLRLKIFRISKSEELRQSLFHRSEYKSVIFEN